MNSLTIFSSPVRDFEVLAKHLGIFFCDHQCTLSLAFKSQAVVDFVAGVKWELRQIGWRKLYAYSSKVTGRKPVLLSDLLCFCKGVIEQTPSVTVGPRKGKVPSYWHGIHREHGEYKSAFLMESFIGFRSSDKKMMS